MAAKPRTIVYVDGFNLYYGAVRGTPYKWLNLEKFFQLVRPHDDIVLIRYFTAQITGPTRPNQDAFLRALATLPKVDITLGTFKQKQIACTHNGCPSPTSTRKYFAIQQEKKTDVNIAVAMLTDAYLNACDQLVLVTGDSDLLGAVKAVRQNFGSKRVVVYVPSRDPARGYVELKAAASKASLLPLNLLPLAQFPNVIPDGAGGTITKPATW